MQQHTGQHLLSAGFAELLGHETVSVHFGVEVATLDLAVDQLPSSAIVAVEERANALVAEGRAVTVRFEDAATATGLRKPPARTGTIRVVTIDGVDRSACGGTHVSTTGAIGPVLLRRVERVRRATRVEFVCGLRAVRRARADFTALSAVAARLSAGVDAVPALVAVQAEAARRGAADAERLAREVAAARAGALVAGLPPDAAGVRRLVVHAGDPVVDGLGAPADALRLVVQAAGALDGVVAVGVAPANPAAHPASGVAPAAAGAGGALVAGGSDTRGGSGTAVMVAAGVGAGIDAGARLRAALGPLGGRGGGTAGFAQGVVPAERLPPLLAALDVGPAPGGDA
jgi:alanyl-tRNA synthetase